MFITAEVPLLQMAMRQHTQRIAGSCFARTNTNATALAAHCHSQLLTGAPAQVNQYGGTGSGINKAGRVERGRVEQGGEWKEVGGPEKRLI